MTSIIDLTFTTAEIRVLDMSIIDEQLPILSDHEVIVCGLTNMKESVGGMGTSQVVTGWSVKTLSD